MVLKWTQRRLMLFTIGRPPNVSKMYNTSWGLQIFTEGLFTNILTYISPYSTCSERILSSSSPLNAKEISTNYTDPSHHHNLQTFTIKSLLSRRQARWAQELAQYKFKIVFRLGKLNGKCYELRVMGREFHGQDRSSLDCSMEGEI